ncbi:MAG TPA: efflux RND transporter periplasmic adaptor subunit [Burkholderiaceae bacterium]|jgi:membrane fusion protein (multidrug efflux system)|nr:efflux RND transporter periplasmic adaptor subunit [Burkholderiaceae bacterium]
MRQVWPRDAGLRSAAVPIVFGLAALWLAGCNARGDTPPKPAPPPAEVTVIRAQPRAVTLAEEYVGQAEAVETVEIRSRVQGLLERQAFSDGATVHRGQLLFQVDRLPFEAALEQAKANLAQAEASAANSAQNLARVSRLISDNAVSQQDLDTAVARDRADRASVEAARAAVHESELNLGYTQIVAPRDGVISKALVKPGSLVTVAQTLLTTLYSSDPIHVNFVLGEQRMLELTRSPHGKAGSQVAFRLRLVDGSDYPHQGKLDFVDAAVDPKNDTLQMRIVVPNPERMLRPGQYVRVLVPTATRPSAILIPQKAVQELQGLKTVYVIGADNKASVRQVTATQRLGSDWVLDGGLQAGEIVVVDGLPKVTPGATVKPVFAAEPAPSAAQRG